MEPSTEQQQQQTCAICLEDLFFKTSSLLQSATTTVKVGAVVPCGHVFHSKCYKRWHSVQRRRHPAAVRENTFRCKCPMCNIACNDFVQIFLGGHVSSPNSGSSSGSGVPSSTAAAASAASIATPSAGGEDESIRDAAKRLDRVKDKLNRYKKENRTLEKNLEDERRHNGENLERTIERHAKERRGWKRQQTSYEEVMIAKADEKKVVEQMLDQRKKDHRKDRRHWRTEYAKMEDTRTKDVATAEEQHAEQIRECGDQKINLQKEVEQQVQEKNQLHHELGRTIDLQVEERRRWEARLETMQKALQTARDDKAKTEMRVAKAVQGIAQMQIYNDIRRDQVRKLTKEKNTLGWQVEELKSALDEEIVIEFE